MRITDCKLNHLVDPLGFQLTQTTFTWCVKDAVGKKQTTARLIVSKNPDMKEILYDTGFANISSLGTTFPLELEPRTRYYWNVTVCTDAGEKENSAIHWFETGKRDEPWQAAWITCCTKGLRHPVFCKTITPEKPVCSARLYICGLGLYEAYLNNQKLGEEYLTPFCNDYNSWLQYQTYDITSLLGQGGELRVLLGNGWYGSRYGLNTQPDSTPYFSSTKKLIAEIRVVYCDGSEAVWGTDESWTIHRSDIIFSGIYDGESVDASLADLPEEPVQLCEETLAPLTERLSPPLTIHEQVPAIALLYTPAGETVLDIGQNLAGIFRLHVHDIPAGRQIRLQFGEALQDGNFYRDNLRTAKAEYCWVSDGKDCILQPHFTFYGYRYVKVEGIENLRKEDFTALALYSEIPAISQIETSNPLVNRLISNVHWGQKSNFIDIPSDCPQRDERLGWTGDAQVFCATANYLSDNYAFYRKYLYDMALEQVKCGGGVPNTVPALGEQGISAVWGDAACIIPWQMYLFTGDISILAEQYPSMSAWVDYITEIDGTDHTWRIMPHFGDWLALDHPSHRSDAMEGATDKGFIADVYYRYSAQITAKAAHLLGRDADAVRYETLAKNILQQIQNEYFSPAGRCCVNTQTGHILTLYHKLWPDSTPALTALDKSLSDVGNELRSGFVGTPLLCLVLSDYDRSGQAYDLLLNEEYPGWLYEIKLGATTIWERWNSLDSEGHFSSTGMNSLNHYSYGAILEWLWRDSAGLVPCEDAPGFQHVRIAPQPDPRLGTLSAIYCSAAGEYRIFWDATKHRQFHMKVSIPFGCHADIVLPYAPDELFCNNDNPLFAHLDKGICHVGPGDYEVSYRTTRPLGKVFTPDTQLKEMLRNPQALEYLRNNLPQAASASKWSASVPLRTWLAQRNIAEPRTLADDLTQIER